MQSLHWTSDQSGLARCCVKLKCLNWYFYPQRTFHRLETVCVAFVYRSGGGGEQLEKLTKMERWATRRVTHGEMCRLRSENGKENSRIELEGASHPSLTFRSLVYLQRAGTALPLVMWNQYLIKAELGRLIGTDLSSGGASKRRWVTQWTIRHTVDHSARATNRQVFHFRRTNVNKWQLNLSALEKCWP